MGQACNGCGYCCSMEPCQLAKEFLGSRAGRCTALEERDGRTVCGLVRNPLAYLYRAAHPGKDVPVQEDPPAAGHQLSVNLATALGLGKGCDADDDEISAAWTMTPNTFGI